MNNNLLPFPKRVYNVLKLCEQQGREDIISWVNDGTAFKVNSLQEFERDLLPKYFNTKKYYSFTRALYAYGFECVRAGRQPGVYSHPNFNRNDPLSPSLIRRVSRKDSRKAGAPNHAVSNTFIAALSNRPFNPRPGKLNSQQICQFPSLLDEPRSQDNDSTATVFGRLYHTIASQVADRVASVPVHRIPPGPEVAGIFDDEGDSMDAGSYPNRTPSTWTTKSLSVNFMTIPNLTTEDLGRKPVSRNDKNRFVLGSCDIPPITSSSS